MFGWDISDASTLTKVNAENSDAFEPKIDDEKRKTLLHGWNRAVERAKGWEEEGDDPKDVDDE